MNETALTKRMEAAKAAVEATLAGWLDDTVPPGEVARPGRLMAAMRHGALNGGKRLRPFLVLEVAALCGAKPTAALDVATALEAVHCYSLIHDDLPAMDDDDLRRGQPTVHVAYDEATAILAGDALLTLAFERLAMAQAPADVRCELLALLARASGVGGMIGGQMLDIAAETHAPDEAGIRLLQSMKTGALIRFACEAGAVLGGADASTRSALVTYGEALGAAFQLADDLLDVTADADMMGKATGKDAARAKGTLVALHGEAKARAMLDDLVGQALQSLDALEGARTLRDTALFVAHRNS